MFHRIVRSVLAQHGALKVIRGDTARLIIGCSGVLLATAIALSLALSYGHPGDVYNYLAAGERLNAGHALYALAPGDRPVTIVAPYWTVPLLSPPLVAVIWRPLALLPDWLSIGIWWGSMILLLAVSIGMVLSVPRLSGALAVYVLAVPLGLEAVQGNINAILLVGALVCWRLFAADRAGEAGFVAGLLTVLKLTPAVLAVWIIVTGGRRGIGGLAKGLGLAAIICVLGAGLGSVTAYISVIRDTMTVGPSALSLAGLLRELHAPQLIVERTAILADLAGLLLIVLLRDRPDRGFRTAVITMVVGSPVVFVNTFLLLLPTIAPGLWPGNTSGESALDHQDRAPVASA